MQMLKNVATLKNGDERLENAKKPHTCIISTENKEIQSILEAKTKEIQLLAQGTALKKVFLKDLEELSLA